MTWNSVVKGDVDLTNKTERGVKHCQILACVKDVKENYHNLSIIMEKLQV